MNSKSGSASSRFRIQIGACFAVLAATGALNISSALSAPAQQAYVKGSNTEAGDTLTAPSSGFLEFHDTTPPPGPAFYRTAQP